MYIPPMSAEYALQQSMAAPFGCFFEDHWDQWRNGGVSPHVMESVNAEAFDRPRRLWPIPQEWFQRMFTQDMWLDQVHRYGLEALKLPKSKFWDVLFWKPYARGYWGTGEERWNRPDDDKWVKRKPNWC